MDQEDELNYEEHVRRAKVEAKLNKRWKALLADMVEELRARGIEKPEIYIEGEAGLYAINGNHPKWDPMRSDRGEAAEFHLGWPNGTGAVFDVGAW